MHTPLMQRTMNMRNTILSAVLALALVACGGSDDAFVGGEGPGPGGPTNQVASVTLLTSTPTIPSDGTSPATVSAFVRNASNQFMANVPVVFSASSGGLQITRSSTDDNGLAQATLSSAGDPANRTITVTAIAGGVTATVSVGVTGTSLSVQGPPALALGQQGTYTATLLSGNQPVANVPVTIASQRTNPLSASSMTTDTNGRITFTLTAANGGNDTITVQGLGLSATQAVSVSSDSFTFTSPAPNAEVNLGAVQAVSVTWTVNGAPVVGQVVDFATTRGTVTASAITNGSGVATANISASNAGGAVITASSGSASTTLPIEFVATTPASIAVQPSSFTIAVGQSSTITAVVRDAAGNLVKNRTVLFTLTDVTGGTLSAGTAVTDSQGRAQTVYTASNTTSANEGVVITATVQGAPAVTGSVALTVARREVFISLGTGNEIQEPNQAQYRIEYVVQVTDSNGNGVPNVPVSMRLLSHQYFKGVRVPGTTSWATEYSLTGSTSPVGAGCADEDANRNGILDDDLNEDFNGNRRLDAGNIALVSPSSIHTNADGFALVYVSYPQEYAYYLIVDLSASASVQGTEYVRTNRFMLPGSSEDFGDLQASPPGPFSPFGIANSCLNPN